MADAKLDTKTLAPAYEPTAHEQRALDAHLARQAEKPLVPKMKVAAPKDGVINLALDHPNPAIANVVLAEALGSNDLGFIDGLLKQLANLSTKGGEPNEGELNFLLAMVRGIEPHDPLEAMLAAHMAVTHNAIMTFARRLALVGTIDQQDSAERAFNKLCRTFAAQVGRRSSDTGAPANKRCAWNTSR